MAEQTYNSYSFDAMWKLLCDNHFDEEFTKELMIGIFWEETMFQNRPQMGGGPAVGFGQVEKPTMEAVNREFGKNYSRTLVLIYDVASVQLSGDCLRMLRRRLPGATRRGILDAYAGTRYRKENGVKVTQWMKCEELLKAGGVEDRDNVRRALLAAEPNHGSAIDSVL